MTWEFIKEILGYVVTGLSTALAGGTFMFFKAKRKTENQKARQEENTADAGRFTNLEREIAFLDKRIESYRYDQQVQNKKMAGMQKIITIVIGQKKYAEYHICKDLACPDRVPVLGSFKTEDNLTLDEDNERDSKKSSS